MMYSNLCLSFCETVPLSMKGSRMYVQYYSTVCNVLCGYIFFFMDRYRSNTNFLDFQVCLSLNLSLKNSGLLFLKLIMNY